jgi:hypothetical protein
MGWRNPTHVIGGRAGLPDGAEAVVVATAPEAVDLWSAPGGDQGTDLVGSLPMAPGDRYPLLAIDAGAEASGQTSAEAYRLWYRIALADGEEAWVQAAIPSFNDTGSDGRPSSVPFDFLPDIAAPE